MAGIHTKNIPHTKNIRLIQATQGCSHIKHSPKTTVNKFLLNSYSQRNISKMKKQRNHSNLKDQENSLEGTNNETDLFSLTDTNFKEEVMKILKELRKAIDRNIDYCKKELETIRRSQ